MGDLLLRSARFYLEFYEFSSSNFDTASRLIVYLGDIFKKYGDKDLSKQLNDSLDALVQVATGNRKPEK